MDEPVNADDKRTSEELRAAARRLTGIETSCDPYELLLRTKAEFENYRKRVEGERGAAFGRGVEALALDVFPVRRNLELALEAARKAANGDSSVAEGIGLTLKSLDDALSRHDIRRIEAVGRPFDARLHEAVCALPTPDHPENTVVRELEPGYMRGEKPLVPARVIVATAPPEEEA